MHHLYGCTLELFTVFCLNNILPAFGKSIDYDSTIIDKLLHDNDQDASLTCPFNFDQLVFDTKIDVSQHTHFV